MAYFIALDNSDPGFDTFVNGKAIARDAERLAKAASSLGLKTPDEYVSMSADDAASMSLAQKRRYQYRHPRFFIRLLPINRCNPIG